MRVLTIDPGEMTGWSIWLDGRKIEGGQTPWREFQDDLCHGLGVQVPIAVFRGEGELPDWRALGPYGPFAGIDLIVCEDFAVYPEGVGDGPPKPWDQLITARLIGGIQLAADMAQVEVVYQGADCKAPGMAALGEDDLARPLHPNRHENDASAHGAYYHARRGQRARP